MKTLNEIQNLFFRIIFRVPISCPSVAFYFEINCLNMELRIWKKKLKLLYYIINSNKDNLAKQILDEQIRHSFPGLYQESKTILKELNISENIKKTKKNIWKSTVNKAIKEKNESNIKEEIKQYSSITLVLAFW